VTRGKGDKPVYAHDEQWASPHEERLHALLNEASKATSMSASVLALGMISRRQTARPASFNLAIRKVSGPMRAPIKTALDASSANSLTGPNALNFRCSAIAALSRSP
jgi:hypothetical protein